MSKLISGLPDELRVLAEIRRQQFADSFRKHVSEDYYNNLRNEDILSRAFQWHRTPEKQPFWYDVNEGYYENVLVLKNEAI